VQTAHKFLTLALTECDSNMMSSAYTMHPNYCLNILHPCPDCCNLDISTSIYTENNNGDCKPPRRTPVCIVNQKENALPHLTAATQHCNQPTNFILPTYTFVMCSIKFTYLLTYLLTYLNDNNVYHSMTFAIILLITFCN